MYDFFDRREIAFQRTAFDFGASAGRNGHKLILTWSQHNLRSQMGQKKEELEGRSHPYRETADYFALLGFLSTTRSSSKALQSSGGINFLLAGPDNEPITPFPELSPEDGAALRELEKAGQVSRKIVSSPGRLLRSHLLRKAAEEANLVVAIGGGKATSMLLGCEKLRPKIIPLSGFGGASEGFSSQLPSFSTAIKSLANENTGRVFDLTTPNINWLFGAIAKDLSNAPKADLSDAG